MKIIKNNYQKTLGFTKCKLCGSVLCIQKTDVSYEYVAGKTSSVFFCGACGHKQAFQKKELTSKKRAVQEV